MSQGKDGAINTQELIARIRAILDDKHGRDIVVLDVRGRSTVTDYHLLVTATSAPHIKALAGDLEHQLKAAGTPCYRRSGSPAAGWVVMDYVDVVTHIFAAEMRRYYDLETLWEIAPPPKPGAPPRPRTRRRKTPPS